MCPDVCPPPADATAGNAAAASLPSSRRVTDASGAGASVASSLSGLDQAVPAAVAVIPTLSPGGRAYQEATRLGLALPPHLLLGLLGQVRGCWAG